MGSVTVVFGGELWPIPPVVQCGTSADIVTAFLKLSVLWPTVKSKAITESHLSTGEGRFCLTIATSSSHMPSEIFHSVNKRVRKKKSLPKTLH